MFSMNTKLKSKMVDLLKLHLFLFYASVSSIVIFIVVYYKTYTDAVYEDIGTLIMVCALTGAIAKPVVCSIADRYNSYKQCLIIALTIMLLFNLPLSILPFYPKLLFNEPHPQFIWFSLATVNIISLGSLGVAITLTDVFVVHKCSNSTTGQYFGQYRFYGVIGWGCCSLSLAFLEQYINLNLPNLALPMMMNPFLIILDLVVVYRLKNIERKETRTIISTISDEYLNLGKQALSKPPPPMAQQSKKSQESSFRSSIRSSINLDSSSVKSENEICLREQLDLLLRLNKYDNYNLFKYLLLLILMGAFIQIHYAFYLEFMVETLRQRNLYMIFFTFNAVNQLCSCSGESLGLLFISKLTQKLDRDITLLLCFTLSGIRYAIVGYLVDYLNIWTLAIIDIQTGILFGLSYTMMTETAASYLHILDKLLLVDTDSTTEQEDKFITHLEQMKDIHSIESIRFALKATLQSLFSGSCEGIGFAFGPFIAGFWLNFRGDSIKILYQDLVIVHSAVLCLLAVLEFGVIRMMLGARSQADKLRLGK